MKVLVIFILLLVFGTIFVVHQGRSYDEHQKSEFQKEFEQPADIDGLTLLARKNRERAIWEKIRDTTRALAADQGVAEYVSHSLDTDRDPQKIGVAALARGRVDENKKTLVRQLHLAGRFGQFDDPNRAEEYGTLAIMVMDDSTFEPSWYDILKNIEEWEPK